MFILKNIAFFLAGVFLIVWGFLVNMDRAGKLPAVKEENAAPEDGQEPKEAAPSPSLSSSSANIRTPKKATVAKKRRGSTTLEKKMPEKATGSQ